jgi:hypothetical protein
MPILGSGSLNIYIIQRIFYPAFVRFGANKKHTDKVLNSK